MNRTVPAKAKGSMILTVIAVIVLFSLIIAALAGMLAASAQNRLTVSYGAQAEMLAHSGTEYALALLFPVNGRNGSLDSPLWAGGTPAPRSVLPAECSSDRSVHPLCGGLRPGCRLARLDVGVREVFGSADPGADVRYEYTITSSAVCRVPFADGSCSGAECGGNSYETRSTEVTKAADIAWKLDGGEAPGGAEGD